MVCGRTLFLLAERGKVGVEDASAPVITLTTLLAMLLVDVEVCSALGQTQSLHKVALRCMLLMLGTKAMHCIARNNTMVDGYSL